MIILRKLFAKKEDENKDSRKKKRVAAGVIAGGVVANNALYNEVKKDMARGVGKRVGEFVDDVVKNSGTKREHFDTQVGPAYSFKNKTVYSKTNNPGIVAHELGHAHYDKASTKMGIGKASHKAYMATGGSLNHNLLSPATGIAVGIVSGKRAARKEAKGEKESKLNRHMAWAAPLIVQSPGLIAEAAASVKGHKMLKANGASKKMLKSARNTMTKAWGTYGTLGAVNAGAGELSRNIAYNKEKSKIAEEKKMEKEKKD